jgi:DNA-directed RNA polymerase beta subunit
MSLTPILTDAATLRQKVRSKVTSALTSVFPLDLKGRKLELTDVQVHAREYSPEDEKAAQLSGSSLNETVKGTLVLKDANGRTLDSAKNFTLAHIPYLTGRHTIIADGNEYQVANQIRRKPGVYTQRANNGELHTVFNLGRGANFDIGFNEEKGTFALQYGTTNIPLYAALRGMGLTHEAIAEKLGAGVAAANRDAHERHIDSALSKLYEKLEHPALQNHAATSDQKAAAIHKNYARTTLDPEVTTLTLGQSHDHVTPAAMLDAAQKILKVHRGEAHPDDTDSLSFKTFHALDDFLNERIRLTARAWAPKAKLALNGRSNIREALKPAPFSDSIRKFITSSSLTAVPTGINPLELIDHAVKVTSMGEGGIASDRAIPYSARMIHNTHFGVLDPIRTPESFSSGVDIRATVAAHRDDAGNLYTVLRNVQTGQDEYIKAGDLPKYVVAFPHQTLSGTVDAFVNGKQTRVSAGQVTHQLTHVGHMYSPATQMIPFIHNIQGNRAIMGSKMGTQALPLLAREAPLVQVKSHLPGEVSYEQLYGHMVEPRATVSGTVKKIENGWIYIQPHREKRSAAEKQAGDAGLVKVPYQDHFPFPSKTYLHHTLSVKPGDKVEAGQSLGESNFTRKGTLSLGRNLLVGYIPYYGYNSNDAVVISEACAKSLTSEHMYREIYSINSQIVLSREKHRLYYGPRYLPEQYRGLDETGVIKKGSKVNPKDILVAGLMPAVVQGTDALLGRIAKSLAKPFKEATLTWEHGVPGTVVDVVKSSGQIAILVKTHEQMQVGDKLAPRYGNKGVVAKIVPDHEMLRDESGKPLDVLFSSAGVISRINPAQIIETAVSKVAEKTGRPIIYDNAAGLNAVQWAKDLLKRHGVKDKETLFDPVLNREVRGADGKGVLVGRQYTYKLFKSTDTNFAGHGVGPYDLNEQPLKTGGDDSAKGLGKMEFDALLAHNARNFLHEAATVKGQKNDEFWRAIQTGLPLPAAKPSFAFNKFVGMLEGAGLKVDRRGSKLHLLPLTDRDVLARSAGSIEHNGTLQAKDLMPEKGGLFDPRKTGGPQGTLYAHIELHEPMPSPVFQEPVRRLLGFTQREFDQHLAEKGGAWFKQELGRINVPKRLGELRAQLSKTNGAELNDLVKQIKYLEALQAHKLTPQSAYMISAVPVIPPVFRPILPQPNDPSQLMVSDANKLYAQLMDSNHTLQHTALESDLGKHRRDLFGKLEELYGTKLPEDPKMQQQQVKGFLAGVAGVGTPKGGFFQRKLMKRTQDVSGRGTAVPDANLNMDEVGIPEQMLWQMLDKLLVARLVRKGYPTLDAREMVNKRAPAAREALLEETRERPVLINRAPTLHRWSVLAAYPKPVQGKTIRVSPFIEKGMNLDYDGDTLQVHVPITTPAIEDAKRMTLGNMLLSDQRRNTLLAFPQHEAVIGITLASKARGSGPTHKFQSREEVIAAWRRGDLKLSDEIEIAHVKAAEESDGMLSMFEHPHYEVDEALSLFPAEHVVG